MGLLQQELRALLRVRERRAWAAWVGSQDFDFGQVKEICRDLLQLLKLFWGVRVGTELEFLVFFFAAST